MELCDQSASELVKLLGKGDVSSRDITESVLTRIDEKEGTTNAYITVTRDIALKQADDADRRFREGKKIPNLNGRVTKPHIWWIQVYTPNGIPGLSGTA